MNRLQNPILGQKLKFKVVEGEVVQVLHSAGNHWLTVSNVGTNVVRVYNSPRTPLPSNTKKQIASLIKSKDASIAIEYANVQVRNRESY